MRYARRSRSVLRGANASPVIGSSRRKPPRPVDWSRITRRPSAGPDTIEGSVIPISVQVEN